MPAQFDGQPVEVADEQVGEREGGLRDAEQHTHLERRPTVHHGDVAEQHQHGDQIERADERGAEHVEHEAPAVLQLRAGTARHQAEIEPGVIHR
ncbi:MAG: hypothetical protein R2713_22505 [Ilumatobacteraceae bacterium]